MSLSFRRLVRTALALAAAAPVFALAGDDAPQFSPEHLEFFEKQVRPIFVAHCLKCHSAEKHKGGLTIGSRENLLKGGDTGPAIVPGKSAESELVRAVNYGPEGYQMPPDGKLPDGLIATLTKWVEIGAPWPESKATGAAGPAEFNLEARAERWSFQPLKDVSPPAVQNALWPRTPIDRFLLDRLEAAGLQPAGETDRRTWLRRAYLDTIGLPPTPSDVAEFVADESPEAYTRVVERLLASPHFGERWGRHWLDLVRYAETRGHEFDYDVPNAWHYRDYVIRALNDDVPYDRFVVEHVAGDLLGDFGFSILDFGLRGSNDSAAIQNPLSSRAREGASTAKIQNRYALRLHPETGANESILATGFWFFGEAIHSPVDIRQEEADRFENMIDVYSKTFLGLTVACARCHDHKFDPITQKDFYALQGYLQSSSYRQAMFETMEHNRRIAEQIDELRQKAAPALLKAYREIAAPVADKFDKYVEASMEAISLGPELKTDAPDIVFDDFESGDYAGWELTGDAFGTEPQTLQTIPAYQKGIRPDGKFFVNSHETRSGGRGDEHVGSMTSKTFTIERDYVRMLVGGGQHTGKTCVNLLVDGQIVHSATGRNSNEMTLVTWDVRAQRGKTGRIQIVDDERGGWGNIGVDHIVFTNQPAEIETPVDPAQFTGTFARQVQEIAQRHELDETRLMYWVAFLMTPERYRHDPLLAWLSEELRDASVPDRVPDNPDRPKQAHVSATEVWLEDAEAIIGYGDNHRAFRTDGVTFGAGCAEPGDIRLSNDPSHPLERIVTQPSWERDAIWDGLHPAPEAIDDVARMQGWQRGGRTLRTSTFEITTGRVCALVYGGCNTYVSVDSHIVINGPLHGSLLKEHPSREEWHWIEHDVSRYQGHRAHVEFVPRGNEPLRIRMVVQSPTAPPAGAVEEATSSASFELMAAANYVMDADIVSPASELGPIVALWYQWMIDHSQLFGLETQAAHQRLAEVSGPYIETQRELISQIRPVSATAPCMLDGSGEDEYVFIRGNWKKPGDTVPREFLEVFHGHGPATLGTQASNTVGSDRLDLTLQMVDPQQTPIVPRVIVNRIWQHYFGRGIVPTPDDFGYMGQDPSHPELLDWLANELVTHDWSLKHIHRLILLSAAYRMASDNVDSLSFMVDGTSADVEVDRPSTINHQPADLDPQNVLLHRMNIKRLEGEIIRDQILAASGRLDDRLYGKSVPVHLTPFMEGRGRPGVSGAVDGEGRRSLYIAVRRNFPDPFFQAFDFPNPHSSVGRRSVSNVPAQALALMNNPFVVEQARVWAERLLRETPGATPEERVARLGPAAFSRPPTDEELASGVGFIRLQAAEYNGDEGDPRVWADFCHVLMNVKEFVFVQ